MLTRVDRFLLSLAPAFAQRRIEARLRSELAVRNYDAASGGRRTAGWRRNRGDANANLTVAVSELRMHARDLERNNGWAKKIIRSVVNNLVGWGIRPRPTGENQTTVKAAAKLWRDWAETTDCDADGLTNLYGLEAMATKSLVMDGEVLIRRRVRRSEDGLAFPLQLQVLEGDFIDSQKNTGIVGTSNEVIQGVEFDAIGRRTAYWLFERHPGNTTRASGVSRRVPASELIHLFDPARPGMVRGVSWLGAAIVNFKDLDEYEDAELMKQKIAACFAAFVTDAEGTPGQIGETSETEPLVETFEPGMISYLPGDRKVTMANPPNVTDASFTTRNLRRVVAAVGGTTYEEVSGDLSQVNYSSARVGRLTAGAQIKVWQNTILIPQMCARIWSWFNDLAEITGDLPERVSCDWTVPPVAMLDPEKEVRAQQAQVRNGFSTFDEVIRENGGDPETHLAEIAATNARLDALKIKLDSDPRTMTTQGIAQMEPQAPAAAAPPPQRAARFEDLVIEVDPRDFA